MSNELEEVWKEAILAFLWVLRMTTENISEDDQCPIQDLNWETCKCSCRAFFATPGFMVECMSYSVSGGA